MSLPPEVPSSRAPADLESPALQLSVLIVSYNTKALTLECVASVIRETRDVAYEIIVVDNASTDGSADAIAKEFPEVHVIASEKNLGFAGANNYAAARARGRTLLLLNPDTVVLDRAVDRLFEFARHHAGIVGGRTLFADGRLNPSSCWGRPTPWSVFCLATGAASAWRRSRFFNPEGLGSWQRDDDRQVDIVSGCFLMLERSLWDRLAGFHLDFFMYGEDADLCLRAAGLGAPSWVCGEARIVHYGGASERVRADKMVRLFTARVQLYERHWPPRWRSFGVHMHDLWAATRWLAWAGLATLRPRFAAERDSWKDVWRRRRAWRPTR